MPGPGEDPQPFTPDLMLLLGAASGADGPVPLEATAWAKPQPHITVPVTSDQINAMPSTIAHSPEAHADEAAEQS